MTTLAGMMQAVAKTASQVFSDGTATAGTTSSLTDTANLVEPGAFWSGGVLYLNTCAQPALSGTVVPITGFGESKLTFATLSKTITAGDTFAVSFNDFSKTELKNAVLAVLNEKSAEQYDDSLTAVSGTTSYALPSGVKNIRRVIVDGTVNQRWHEINGELVFPSTYAPTEGTIELIYFTPQGDISETSEIHPFYDFEAVKWSALVNLWRRRLYKAGADDSQIIKKIEEAKANEAMAWAKARKAIPTDMRLA